MHLAGIFIYLLPFPHLTHRYMSASAQHSVRCLVPSLFLLTKIHFSFGLGLSFFTIFSFLYQAMEAGRILQKLHTPWSGCLETLLMLDSLVRVSQQQQWKNLQKKNLFFFFLHALSCSRTRHPLVTASCPPQWCHDLFSPNLERSISKTDTH